MTATPDLSEDYPALSGLLQPDPQDRASTHELVLQEEGKRALAELAGLRRDVAYLSHFLQQAENTLAEERARRRR